MNDARTARAQIGLAYLYAIAFLADLAYVIVKMPDLTETAKVILLPMLGWLGALVQQHSSYFFARQRPDSSPPTTPTDTGES